MRDPRSLGRPPWAVVPGPGQESVWDYPRPPRLERVAARVRVEVADVVVADSRRAWRVCETAGAPCYYVPPADVRTDCLLPSATRSLCEWKSAARYWNARIGGFLARDAAWSYPDPTAAFEPIRGHFAFYAGRVGACFVGADRVAPQPGGFYGGWVTPNLVGPIKGEPGSEGW